MPGSDEIPLHINRKLTMGDNIGHAGGMAAFAVNRSYTVYCKKRAMIWTTPTSRATRETADVTGNGGDLLDQLKPHAVETILRGKTIHPLQLRLVAQRQSNQQPP